MEKVTFRINREWKRRSCIKAILLLSTNQEKPPFKVLNFFSSYQLMSLGRKQQHRLYTDYVAGLAYECELKGVLCSLSLRCYFI